MVRRSGTPAPAAEVRPARSAPDTAPLPTRDVSWGPEEPRLPDSLLRSALHCLLDPFEILQAIRDDTGRIVDYRFRYLNLEFAAAAGRSVEELTGARVLEKFPNLDPTLKAWWDEVVDTGRPLVGDAVEMHSVVYDASRRFDLRGFPLDDGLALTFRDVTERFEATEQLRVSERRYRLLAENTSDVVYVVDGDLIRWASPSCYAQLGWTPEELRGRRWDAILAPADVAAAHALQRQARPVNVMRGGLAM